MAKYASYYSSSLGPLSVARVLICKQCHKYIASMDDLLSRAYCGAQSPKAGLFDDVSNVCLGPRQVWLMRTGAHTVRELKCLGCSAYVGFQIVHAHEPSERWKNGAYILERHFLFIHSIYECSSSDCESDDSSSEERSYQWPGTPLRLKVVEDLRKHRRTKRMTVMSPSTKPAPLVTDSSNKPLPHVPVPVGAC
ncbi:hypothetical protein A7U60_g2508 [Sanghuangporus baumii]|uniref:Yippee domain-containing protein n=1 Tax=Sanghuangporus baumii TaxID=108892 RepID=A0A9Q5I314_SANBA|nr:hypothetical protein A7U60_g2508 [Sanghuangporus baumii]